MGAGASAPRAGLSLAGAWGWRGFCLPRPDSSRAWGVGPRDCAFITSHTKPGRSQSVEHSCSRGVEVAGAPMEVPRQVLRSGMFPLIF